MQFSMASRNTGCGVRNMIACRPFTAYIVPALQLNVSRLASHRPHRLPVPTLIMERLNLGSASPSSSLVFPRPTSIFRPACASRAARAFPPIITAAAHKGGSSNGGSTDSTPWQSLQPSPAAPELLLQRAAQWEALRRKVMASLLALALAVGALLSTPSVAVAEPDRAGIFGGLFNKAPSTPTAAVTMENKEPFPSSSDLSTEELATVKLFQDNTPSVVNIANIATARSYFSTDVMRIPQGQGSGFVWDDKGHIVTNFHVIRGAYEVQVALIDQTVHKAKIIGGDSSKDIAVLQLQAPPSVLNNMKPVVLGQSSGLFVGQKVYAIGNPFGLDHTLTSGIISGLNRELGSGNGAGPSLRNMVQTDASINPGNSGGPLLDSKGRLIGINTAIADPSGRGASSGVGFAIPIDQVKGLVEQILTYGRVMRPVLGITIAPQQAVRQLDIQGVLVLGVPPGTPAAKAGLQGTYRDEFGRLVLGDVIVGVNGAPIKSEKDLYNLLDSCKVGETVRVDVLRKGNEKQTISVTLAERAPEMTE